MHHEPLARCMYGNRRLQVDRSGLQIRPALDCDLHHQYGSIPIRAGDLLWRELCKQVYRLPHCLKGLIP